MSSFENHIKKFSLFKRDAENKANSPMTRINAYFEASFHLIEACASLIDVHINKHQNIRKATEENPTLFGDDTKHIWNAFQDLENKIRPGQAYGGRINGEQLEKAKKLFEGIYPICKNVIREKGFTKEPESMFSLEEERENAA